MTRALNGHPEAMVMPPDAATRTVALDRRGHQHRVCRALERQLAVPALEWGGCKAAVGVPAAWGDD